MAGRYDLGLFLVLPELSHAALLGGLEAVKGAAPYEPFPFSIRRSELRIRALFVYE
jgi:hypothetical protein